LNQAQQISWNISAFKGWKRARFVQRVEETFQVITPPFPSTKCIHLSSLALSLRQRTPPISLGAPRQKQTSSNKGSSISTLGNPKKQKLDVELPFLTPKTARLASKMIKKDADY